MRRFVEEVWRSLEPEHPRPRHLGRVQPRWCQSDTREEKHLDFCNQNFNQLLRKTKNLISFHVYNLMNSSLSAL